MKITQDPKFWIQNSISFKSFSAKTPFPINSELRRGTIGETGGKRNVEEGSHQKTSTIKRGVCKQFIPCKKEGWGPKTSDKFEATECRYPIFSLILDLIDAYFSVPLEKKFKTICSIPLVKKLVRVPLPLLWFGASTTNIHKITKSANDSLTQDKHQNINLLRRHKRCVETQ